MDATRRLANGARRYQPPGHLPPLLLLRIAIGLLVILASVAGAATADPLAATEDPRPVAAAVSPRNPFSEAPGSATPARRKRSVFVCDDAGTPVFSDRPCGPDLVLRSISVALPSAGQVASTAPPVPRASTRPRVRVADRSDPVDEIAERCTALRRQLDELDDRMRTGYSSREAARLWERRRNLKSDLRTAGC
jgi:hypothetical protein